MLTKRIEHQKMDMTKIDSMFRLDWSRSVELIRSVWQCCLRLHRYFSAIPKTSRHKQLALRAHVSIKQVQYSTRLFYFIFEICFILRLAGPSAGSIFNAVELILFHLRDLLHSATGWTTSRFNMRPRAVYSVSPSIFALSCDWLAGWLAGDAKSVQCAHPISWVIFEKYFHTLVGCMIQNSQAAARPFNSLQDVIWNLNAISTTISTFHPQCDIPGE